MTGKRHSIYLLTLGLDEDGYEVSRPKRERSSRSHKRSSTYEDELEERNKEIDESSSEDESTTQDYTPNTQV